jgi:hypothetical protein
MGSTCASSEGTLPNFVRQSCPEIGEYDDLEGSKNRRSASWHGNQHVRLRGAQIRSIAAPTRLKDHQDSGGAVGAEAVVLQRGSSQDFSQGRRKEGCRRDGAAFISTPSMKSWPPARPTPVSGHEVAQSDILPSRSPKLSDCSFAS